VETIQQAGACVYGMPAFPLSTHRLIGNTNGVRRRAESAVECGFPHRMNPSALVARAGQNRKLAGVAVGERFFNQYEPIPGTQLADLCRRATARTGRDLCSRSFCGFCPFRRNIRASSGRPTCFARPRFRLRSDADRACGVADNATIDARDGAGLRWKSGRTNAGPIERITATRANELADQFPELKINPTADLNNEYHFGFVVSPLLSRFRFYPERIQAH